MSLGVLVESRRAPEESRLPALMPEIPKVASRPCRRPHEATSPNVSDAPWKQSGPSAVLETLATANAGGRDAGRWKMRLRSWLGRTNDRRKRRTAAGMAAVLMALGAVAATSANAANNWGTPYSTSNSRCTTILVSLNDAPYSSGGGYLRTFGMSMTFIPPSNPCQGGLIVPAGSIRVNQVMQKMSGGSWVYCAGTQTGDYYNSASSYDKAIATNYGATPRCGAGTYRGMGRTWVDGNGGAVVAPASGGIGL